MIRRFMIKRLKLQGVPLLLYARIYGFSLGGNAGCYESQRSMAESLGVSERAIGKALKALKERGLIVEVGQHRLRNGRTTKVFRAVGLHEPGAGTNCPTRTKFPEQSSGGAASTVENGSSLRPNGVPAERKEIVNNEERKGSDGFERYSF